MTEFGGLSSRASVFCKPSLPYGEVFVSKARNCYREDTNEDGNILVAVSENKLCSKMIMERINRHRPFNANVLYYSNCTGTPYLKSALCQFLPKYVFSGCTIDPAHLVISPGCTALLQELSVLLFEPDESILVPAPYYPAFDHDFLNLGSVHCIPIHNFSIDTLQAAYDRALSKHPPKALLLTNPHNPLGTIFSNRELLDIVNFCKVHSLHLIVDEVYALSTFSGAFTSITSLLNNALGDNIHVIWGVSKDFGASGVRMGVLYSHNRMLLRALGSCNDAFQVSNITQALLAELLTDDTFLTSFIDQNKQLLFQQYTLVTSHLTTLNIPYVPAASGLFVFFNLQSCMSSVSFEAERALFQRLADIGVVLTPGESCHNDEPGWFRMCYAWVTPKAIDEAFTRIKKFII